MRPQYLLAAPLIWIALTCTGASQTPTSAGVFERENLMAWCIVPFDSAKRSPQQRAEMLRDLGIRKFAYDYRAEHVSTFDDEIEQLKKHGIELSAWWFPGELNAEARLILEKLEKHGVRTQLWITGNGGEIGQLAPEEQRRRVLAEAVRIRPIAEAAAKIGCSVGLYNHGGWFGEPDNQIEIIAELNLPNVGIVYNQHHGHEHTDHFAELLARMKPHLLALNLNGMTPDGERNGQKILPLGAGSLDLRLLRVIEESGYAGPIGILNHTDEDAEARLRDNLDGLEWLTRQLDGTPATKRPQYRSWQPVANPPPSPPPLSGKGPLPFPGKLVDGKPAYRSLPLTLACTATLTQQATYNILVANDTKASGTHWELFTQAGSGHLCVYLPGFQPDHVRTTTNVCDSKPHHIALLFDAHRVRLLVDGAQVADQATERNEMAAKPGGFAIGRLVEGGFGCFGAIDRVELRSGIADPAKWQLSDANRSAGPRVNSQSESVWHFWPNFAEELPLIGSWQFKPQPVQGGQPAAASPATNPQVPTVQAYDPQIVRDLSQSVDQGNAARGIALFASAKSACLSCHQIGEFGGTVGPNLSKIGMERSTEQLVESLLWPNRGVEPKYQMTQILTDDGNVVRGFVVEEDSQRIHLSEPSSGKRMEVAVAEIEDRKDIPSIMPENLVNGWSRQQQLDLLALLTDLGRHDRLRPELAASVLKHAQSHDPTPFPFDRQPLDAAAWPSWQADVNRQRLYDFYAKEANYFRTEDLESQLLMEFPGLDGGPLTDPTMGHWGNQNEDTWANDSWNQATLGSVQSGVFHGADRLTVPRAVCLQLGEDGGLNACFDPQTLTYPAVWRGEFVRFSTVRHGFLHGLSPIGELVDEPETKTLAAAPTSEDRAGDIHYQGMYRVGKRVVFAYDIGGVPYLDAPWADAGKFVREVGPRATHSMREHLQSGQQQWPQRIETEISLGTLSPYAVDTIGLPTENPWNTPLYCSGHDFLPDGSALLATMQGDVWHVSGLSAGANSDGKAVWRRFASGLHHPLGLTVDRDGIFVLCRDQLLRLHDRNGDGEADFQECFCGAFETSPAGHDFICGLERDALGNFYTASGNEGLVRISPDGKQATTVAAGFRNPDGLGIHPGGFATVPCSEGEWTPASMICAVPLNQSREQTDSVPFHGYRGSRFASTSLEAPQLPLVYLPRGLDNSAGGQVVIDSDRWGPLEGNMLHLSFGTGSQLLLLDDEVDGQLQGAVVPLPGEFLSGVHRGRFSPADGQLYVSGMAGWGSYTPEPGCFQRVRYTGEPVVLPVGFHVHENGVSIRFSQPLNASFCEDASNHFAQAWNYRYSAAYGSAEYSTLHYGVRGHDRLRIASAHVIDGGDSIFLEIPELQMCNQLHLQLAVGEDRRVDMFATCNRLDAARRDIEGLSDTPKQLAAHPLELDMLMAVKKVDNPWQTPIAGAREVRIEAGKNLTFATRSFTAKPREALALTLVNPDVVPHNFALVEPGKLQSVGEQANLLIADPEALIRQYVPQTNEVICHTDIVEPNQEFTVYFRVPEKPGRYPYLCTFPGHWMVMNGEMQVED